VHRHHRGKARRWMNQTRHNGAAVGPVLVDGGGQLAATVELLAAWLRSNGRQLEVGEMDIKHSE